MAEPYNAKGLELDSDVPLQERLWRAERIAWALTVLILIVALLGGFGGSGPLSRGHYEDPSGRFEVEYLRLVRHSTKTTVSVRFQPSPTAELWFDNRYLEGISVERIQPEPQSVARSGDRTYFRFQTVAPGDALEVRLEVTPTGYGPLDLGLGVPEGPLARLSVFVFP